MAEARDSLVDATEAFEADGLSRLDAEEHAVQDFGDLAEVAPGYRSELGLAQGRQTAVMLCLVMLVQPIIWKEGVWRWNEEIGQPSAFIAFLNDLIVVVGSLAIVGAVVAVVASGIGVRYPLVRERASRTIAVFVLVVCLLVSVIGVCLSLSNSPRSLVESISWVAAFVLIPLAIIGRSAHRCLRLA